MTSAFALWHFTTFEPWAKKDIIPTVGRG